MSQYNNPNQPSITVVADYATFIATVDALIKLYPTITKTVAIANSQAIFTDVIKTPDAHGATLTDLYGKQVATDIVGAMIRRIAYGYYLSRPVLVVAKATA
jgi:hypothetical protein